MAAEGRQASAANAGSARKMPKLRLRLKAKDDSDEHVAGST